MNPITSLAASGGTLAHSGQNQILLYGSSQGEFVDVLAFPEGDVFDLCYSSDGTKLFAAGGTHAASGKVIAWDVGRKERLAEYGDEFDTLLALDVSPDGKTLIFGGAERILKLVDAASGRVRNTLTKHTDWIFDIAINPDGLVFASADRAGNLFVWETQSGEHIHTLRGHRGAINGVAWLQSDDVFITGGDDGTVRTWDVHSGKQIASWVADSAGVLGVAVTAEDSIIAIGRSGYVSTWHRDGKPDGSVKLTDSFPTEVATDESTVVLGDSTGAVHWLSPALDKQGVLKVPTSRTTEDLTALKVAPRMGAEFRVLEPLPMDTSGAISDSALNIDTEMADRVLPEVGLDTVGSVADGASATLLMKNDATAPFQKFRQQLAAESQAYERIVSQITDIEKSIRTIEAQLGSTPAGRPSSPSSRA